ncbi:long-chain fatty acid--CoA ligase [Streptomyces griseofuscus]|uniref:acyl-CoA synthetase n=1 Tax=Streptomyces griseofuscus TaxID=146922 RepID=UPI0033D4F3C6
MRNEGIGSWPARRARKTPDQSAFFFEGRSVGYAEFAERSTRLAHALRSAGIGRDDRVAYIGPNHPALLETLFAAGMLGAIFIPLNTRLAGPEIAYQLQDCRATVLICDPGCAELVDGTALLTIEVGADYESRLEAAATEPIDEPVTAADVCMLMYTSGTTGRPKGAMLTHGNITWNAVNVLVDNDITSAERGLISAPLFHTASLNLLALPVFLKGGTCHILEGFDPAKVLAYIERHRITFTFGVPTMYDLMARQPGWAEADLSSLRLLTCGGAPVPTSLISLYQQRGLEFLQGYGMTEVGPAALCVAGEYSVTKAGSAGVPVFFGDVRVAGQDGADVEAGAIGEVLISGPQVSPGYWGLSEASAAAFTGDWFRSGDAAWMDADGYVTIADRIKDMYISGGENVYPAEVEDALIRLPGVAECAVVGVPDEKWGEAGRAVVVPDAGVAPDPDQLLARLRDVLAHYKVPKSLVLVDELPRNASGKLLKQRIRAEHGG